MAICATKEKLLQEATGICCGRVYSAANKTAWAHLYPEAGKL